jgi:hypothetical protein
MHLHAPKPLIAFTIAIATACQADAALTFNISSTGNAQADAGFAAAGARWSALFSDDITVNITAGFSDLGDNILGSASSSSAFYYYSGVRDALVADKTSANDTTATSNLPASPELRLMLNYTLNHPTPANKATPYLDSDGDLNNQVINVTHANAKALGLRTANDAASDTSISFSNTFTWDFDPSNGINAGAYDFVGVATHEIGHALGFISGVDVLDANTSSINDQNLIFVTTLDLYRYSALSVANNALDWTADTRSKFLSINGGATSIATLSTGTLYGDGNQASHWKDDLGIGILDPTADTGELLVISETDKLAFDVIGYDLTPIPEPATYSTLIGLLLLGFSSSNRRRNLI